jgi:hypothetical protein
MTVVNGVESKSEWVELHYIYTTNPLIGDQVNQTVKVNTHCHLAYSYEYMALYHHDLIVSRNNLISHTVSTRNPATFICCRD